MYRPRRSPGIGSSKLYSRVGTPHFSSHLHSVPEHFVGRIGPRERTYSYDPKGRAIFPTPEPEHRPRLTIRCDYGDEPLELTFSLAPSYGIHTVIDADGWFRRMMREHEEFEVDTDRPGEPALFFRSSAVLHVMAE
jgi:hypothetical protein